MATTSHAHESATHQACIDACLACHRTCTETLARHCLEHGGAHVQAAHLRLMLDCAEICSTSANFLMRGSELHHVTCQACAEICAACAENCRGFEDAEMQACADACAQCAESCRRMTVAA